MKVAVVLGSTRPGRQGEAVARWVLEQLGERTDPATYQLLDLAEFDLPLLAEPTVPGAAGGHYENPKTRAWSQAISGYDAFIWVTPEYNHSVPAALKNAFDVLYPEWQHKAVYYVSYGSVGGVRAVEHWRVIHANAEMFPVRAQLILPTHSDWDAGTFSPLAQRAQEVRAGADALESMAVGVAGFRTR